MNVVYKLIHLGGMIHRYLPTFVDVFCHVLIVPNSPADDVNDLNSVSDLIPQIIEYVSLIVVLVPNQLIVFFFSLYVLSTHVLEKFCVN